MLTSMPDDKFNEHFGFGRGSKAVVKTTINSQIRKMEASLASDGISVAMEERIQILGEEALQSIATDGGSTVAKGSYRLIRELAEIFVGGGWNDPEYKFDVTGWGLNADRCNVVLWIQAESLLQLVRLLAL